MKRWLALVMLLVTGAAWGLDDAKTAKAKYDALAVRVTAGDLTIDWREFRLAAQAAGVNGDFDWREADKRAQAAMNAKNYEAGLVQAKLIIAHNLASPNGHFDAYVAYKNLGNTEAQRKERLVLDSILKSIADSGDGKSAKTAWFTVATSEEYLFLALTTMLRPKGQALVHADGHDYDKMTVVDDAGAESAVWFNTDTDMQMMAAAFGGK